MPRLLFLAAIAGLAWSAPPSEPNAAEIVQRSMQQTAANWNQAPNYSFVERDLTSKRDSKPAPKTYQVLQIDGSPYNRLISVDDQTLSAGEQAAEDRKLRNEMRRRERETERERAKRVTKYLKERSQDRALLTGMIEAFDFKVSSQEAKDGHECWVIEASPRPGYQPRNQEMKVLAGMRGRFWVDQASGNWVRVEAEVFQTVSLSGFFAKVRPGTQFLLEQAPIAGGVWLPRHFSTQVNATAFGFINGDSTEDETYFNYQPMPETLARLGSQ